MNLFRLAGDLSHLFAIILLLCKIWKTRSCAGISGRSQILFASVYITRYSDLLCNYVSAYNSVMKIVFIGTSLATLYLIYFKFKATYERNNDTFRVEFLVIPMVILAIVLNHEFTRLEVLWTFSIYLESVAILPQLFMVFKAGKLDTILSIYLCCLGSYRALYIPNWVYRYYTEGFYDLIAVVPGIVQTIIYCVFFFLYIIKRPKSTSSDDSLKKSLVEQFGYDELENKQNGHGKLLAEKWPQLHVKQNNRGMVADSGISFPYDVGSPIIVGPVLDLPPPYTAEEETFTINNPVSLECNLPNDNSFTPNANFPQNQLGLMQARVSGVSLDECHAAYVEHKGDFGAAVKELQLMQLCRLGIAPKEDCQKALISFNWNAQLAASALMDQLQNS